MPGKVQEEQAERATLGAFHTLMAQQRALWLHFPAAGPSNTIRSQAIHPSKDHRRPIRVDVFSVQTVNDPNKEHSHKQQSRCYVGGAPSDLPCALAGAEGVGEIHRVLWLWGVQRLLLCVRMINVLVQCIARQHLPLGMMIETHARGDGTKRNLCHVENTRADRGIA